MHDLIEVLTSLLVQKDDRYYSKERPPVVETVN